jgi:hypothetical protein
MYNRIWDIWVEGFRMDRFRGRASFIDKAIGKTFQEACDKYYEGHGLYNSKNLSFWGCKLFDNEDDARKSHG